MPGESLAALYLLRGDRQLQEPVRILLSSQTAAEEVAGEAESEEPDELGEVQRLGRAISSGGASDHGESASTNGASAGVC